MNLEEILQKQANGATLTKEEVDYIISSFSKAVSGKVPDTEKKGTDLETFMAELQSATDALRKSPEGQAQLREAIAGRREQRFVKKYTPFFNAVLAGADIAQSLSQIRSSDRAIQNMNRPGMPAVPGIDPRLDAAIRDAELGTMDAARAIGPARQVIDDQYANDISLAKSVGGGQASTFGALGQVASMRRGRAAASLAPIIDQVRAREQGRLDTLLDRRAQQTNQNYYNRFRQYQNRQDQYNNEAKAAGQLGSVGRLNLRNSFGSLLNAVPGVAARATGRGFGDKYSEYEQQLNKSLVSQQPSTAFSESEIYGNQVPINLEDNYTSNIFYNPFNR